MKCLILGVGGQDGSYLADILLKQGHEVHGVYRRSSVDNLTRVKHLLSPPQSNFLQLHQGDITDLGCMQNIFKKVRPHEIYNVADQDHVGWSLNLPSYSFDVTVKAVSGMLDILSRELPQVRFFQACSATMFGDAKPPQTLNTPLNPQSPYAIAKAAVYHVARYYRQVHGMFVATGFLFNHDSGRRGSEYLLHRICDQCLDVAREKTKSVTVGDPEMLVDIGWARDYMKAAVKSLRQLQADDYLISSGWARNVKEWVDKFYVQLGITKCYLLTNKSLLRPGSQPRLFGGTWTGENELGMSVLEDSSDLVQEIIYAEKKATS